MVARKFPSAWRHTSLFTSHFDNLINKIVSKQCHRGILVIDLHRLNHKQDSFSSNSLSSRYVTLLDTTFSRFTSFLRCFAFKCRDFIFRLPSRKSSVKWFQKYTILFNYFCVSFNYLNKLQLQLCHGWKFILISVRGRIIKTALSS